MKIILLIFAVFQPWSALSQLELMPKETMPAVFCGEGRMIEVAFRNSTKGDLEAELDYHLFQASSATLMPIGSIQPWKKLRILAGQTVLEAISLNIPQVKMCTRFIVKWMEKGGNEVGKMEVLVYSPNQLAALKPLAGNKPLGICAPHGQLKSLLKDSDVEFEDLEESGWDKFHGQLAFVGPFTAKQQTPHDLRAKIMRLATRGVTVVWIQAPVGNMPQLEPSLYSFHAGLGHVVVVPAKTVDALADKPISQLNLVRLADFGVRPEHLEPPNLNP